MSEKDFVLRMILTYMQHYGMMPSEQHISEYKKLYHSAMY